MSLHAEVLPSAEEVALRAAAGLRAGTTLAGDLPAVRLLRRIDSSLWGFVRLVLAMMINKRCVWQMWSMVMCSKGEYVKVVLKKGKM